MKFGRDLDESLCAALAASGIDADVTVTNDPTEIPDDALWVHSPYMGLDRLLAGGWVAGRLLTRTVHGMPQRMARYVREAVGPAPSASLDAANDNQRTDIRARALVFGTGEVGAVAARALTAEGWTVDGVNSTGRPVAGFERVTTPSDIADPSRYRAIVLALPATAATSGLVGTELLDRLRGARLVNVGRGTTLDLDAALVALASGALAHATLDVLPVEPLPADSPLLRHPGLTITPHIAGPTEPDDVVRSLEEAVADLAAGHSPRNAVDPARGY